MNRPLLLLIDLQPSFPAAQRIIKPVLREIKKAIRDNRPIFNLEYGPVALKKTPGIPYLPVYAKITKALKGYSNFSPLQKCEDDGSYVVLHEIWKGECEFDHIRVCGVNADACVHDTVYGISLHQHIPMVIVRKACTTNNPYFNWDSFLEIENVEIE